MVAKFLKMRWLYLACLLRDRKKNETGNSSSNSLNEQNEEKRWKFLSHGYANYGLKSWTVFVLVKPKINYIS